ncbi:hypothetical protein MLD38_025022 [Melastoma candidum]|uniref:Uncharacterized protein n=1 Tax=Melastoma candidum TaxID=119954 RepID=A0ACB9NWY8_9MYRT|nr:hypothetical protein MLD38_025022 [Melastoma candidum]
MAARILAMRFSVRFRGGVLSLTDGSLSTEDFARISSSRFSFSTHASQSLFRKQVSLSNLFRRYGFPHSDLPSFLEKNRYVLDFRLNEVEKSLAFLSSLKVPRDLAVSVIMECPGILEYDFLKEWERMFRESGLIGLSQISLLNVIKCSRRSGVNAHGFGAVVSALKGLGFRDNTCRKIFEEFPGVVAVEELEIYEKVKFIEGIGITRDGCDYLFYKCPRILGFGVENRLRPLLSEFRRVCSDEHLLREEILREPSMLGMEPGEISRCLQLLMTLKCRDPIRGKILSEGVLRAAFEVKLRVDCLCRHGLIYRGAFKVLWKEPRAILYLVEEIERKIEFLLNVMKFDINSLADVPEYLGVSLEKQIIPRYNVIEHLQSMGGLGDPVDLKGLIRLSTLKFYNLYVKPYPECERIFGKAKAAREKSYHPVGLWKMLKPEKHTLTRRDTENIRCFVEGLG